MRTTSLSRPVARIVVEFGAAIEIIRARAQKGETCEPTADDLIEIREHAEAMNPGATSSVSAPAAIGFGTIELFLYRLISDLGDPVITTRKKELSREENLNRQLFTATLFCRDVFLKADRRRNAEYIVTAYNEISTMKISRDEVLKFRKLHGWISLAFNEDWS